MLCIKVLIDPAKVPTHMHKHQTADHSHLQMHTTCVCSGRRGFAVGSQSPGGAGDAVGAAKENTQGREGRSDLFVCYRLILIVCGAQKSQEVVQRATDDLIV